MPVCDGVKTYRQTNIYTHTYWEFIAAVDNLNIMLASLHLWLVDTRKRFYITSISLISSLTVCRMRSEDWTRSTQHPCRSPAGLIPVFTPSLTPPTLTSNANVTSPRLLRTFWFRRSITTWGQKRSGTSGWKRNDHECWVLEVIKPEQLLYFDIQFKESTVV